MRPLTHDDIMGRKCGLCLGNKSLCPISQTMLTRIKKYFYKEYTIIPILMMMLMMIIIMMAMMMIMMMTRIATKSAVHDRRTNSSWIDCLPDRCCCRCRKNLLIMSSPSLLFYHSPDFLKSVNTEL